LDFFAFLLDIEYNFFSFGSIHPINPEIQLPSFFILNFFDYVCNFLIFWRHTYKRQLPAIPTA